MDYKNIGRNTQVGTFVAAPTIVAIDSTVGTNYGVYNIGGYKEVYKLSDLEFALTGGTAGQILQNSGNTIPVVFTPRPNTLFSDKVAVNDDGMSSGRRRLGMLVYVHETDTVYQYTIPNYSALWSAATNSNAIVADGDGWTVLNKVPNNPGGSANAQGQALIDAWTGSTIEGVNGVTAANARWRIFWGTDWQVTGGTIDYNTTGDLSLSSNSGNTVTISGLKTITGGTFFSGTSTLELYNNLGDTISITGFTGGSGGSGSSGSSGTSGSSGSSGTSGISGVDGTSGSSGSSGTSGISGVDGTSGSSGSSGTSGSSGSSGTSGSSGSSGTSGISGVDGTSGSSGSSGTSGSSGRDGISAGKIYYFNESETQTPSTYKNLSTTASTEVEQTITSGVTNGSFTLISQFITDELGFGLIPGGVQTFHLHFLLPQANADMTAYCTLELANSAGTSYGNVLTTNENQIPWIDATTPVEVYPNIIFPNTVINTSDRMIVKIYVKNLDSTNHDITWYTEGNTNYSFVTTSIGISGSSGTSGSSGSSGTSGSSGSSGTSGSSGSSGTSGISGVDGTSGSSGSSGTSGSSGSSGTSGISGVDGTSGSSGSSGTSGNSFTGGTITYDSNGRLTLENENLTDNITIDGFETITGGTYFSGTSTIQLTDNLGNNIDITGITTSTDISVSANTGLGIVDPSTLYTIYNSTLSSDLAMASDVGGIEAGTTVSDLTGQTFVQLFNDLLFPTVLPTYTVPTITTNGISNQTVEVGTSQSINFTGVGTKNDAGEFTSIRLRKNSSDVVTDNSPTEGSATDIPDQFGFTNNNNPNHTYTSSAFTETLTVPAPTGGETASETTYNAEGDCNAGVVKKDNKGNDDTRGFGNSSNTPQNARTNLSVSDRTISGVYPYWYGKSSTQPTISSIQDAISGGTANKSAITDSQNGQLQITFGAVSEFIWFAHFEEYTAKVSYQATNNPLNKGNFGPSDVLNTFVTAGIDSPDGYWTNVNYKIYIGNYQTDTTGFGSMDLNTYTV